ncbi:MAG: hypothetical protein H6749_06025 [Nitrospiraceae bacterium]|nr:hypothetical protein [Nitrospiraceae bacterium]
MSQTGAARFCAGALEQHQSQEPTNDQPQQEPPDEQEQQQRVSLCSRRRPGAGIGLSIGEKSSVPCGRPDSLLVDEWHSSAEETVSWGRAGSRSEY